jgi:hypothetical protein
MCRAEATIFTPPELTTATDRVALNLIRHNFPLASEWELGKIAALYPSPEKSNDRYKTQWERIDKLIGGSTIAQQLLLTSQTGFSIATSNTSPKHMATKPSIIDTIWDQPGIPWTYFSLLWTWTSHF